MSLATESPAPKKVWTDSEFMALPEDGHRYEIVAGELIDMGNSGALHGYVCSLLLTALTSDVLPRKLGVVLDSSTAFTMKNGNRRSPDISFFAKERLQGITELPTRFLEGAPDLAVEVLSPGNTIEELDQKIAEYFANQARLVWIVSPTQRYVLVYRSSQEPDRLLKSTDFLAGEAVIPDFRFPVAELFQSLSF
ncbi:MAG: Uma2 family endonuclease [Spirulinaceae cyanobacterium SM2_1_0]|nr:Uma2 family endonuclease [Spirulinaceae cyanobacterium SM2_1_0]